MTHLKQIQWRAGTARRVAHGQRGSVLTYFLFLAAAVAVAGAVALTHITALSKLGSDSRGNLLTQRALTILADSAVGLGYAEGSDGRPGLPSGLTYVSGTGAPAGGTLLPVGIGPSRATDAWGSPFGFCNFASATWNGWNTPLFAVVSAGRDRTWQTSCSDVFSGIRRGDDLVRVVSEGDWRAQGTKGKTDAYQPPLALLSQLNTVVPVGPGEMRVVLETKELYVNPTGAMGASNWELVSGAGVPGAKYIMLDSRNMRKWSDGTMATSCAGYYQGGSGYAYTGAIGDGVYWVNPAGTPYGMYCDMTTEMAGRTFFTNLIAYWPMDVNLNGGAYALDQTGVHNFALNAVTTYNAAVPFGSAGVRVSGTNPVALPELLAQNPNQVTISAWLDMSTMAQTTGVMPFGFNLWDVWTGSTGGALGFNTANSDVVGVSSITGVHHFVFVFDRRASSTTSFAQDERIYIDGIRQPLALVQGNPPTAANRVWQSVLNIGGWSASTSFQPVNGYFQDVAVWTRALTDAEVSVLYGAGHNTFGSMLTWQAGFVWNATASAVTNAEGTALASCQAYYKAGARVSARYLINPTGAGAFPVVCNMTLNGGGWTLLMRQAAGDGTTLQGDTTYWTTGTPLNDTVANLNFNDGNLVSKAFSTMTVTQYLLQAGNESTVQSFTRAASTPLVAFSNANVTNYTDANGVPGAAVTWFIHATTYPNGQAITQARFGFNFMEIGGVWACGARWGWAANQDPNSAPNPGTDDSCGGLGAYGSEYGSAFMNNNKNAWQPATLYLWAR
ncbi:hypothetical protein G3A43_08045 [Paraburkholderia aspalathi]|nr:fibrinogen-like YCDxxxxGGGW domain-containing protein [Paraburkholderia aspalathi]MBK3780207.1 hypothetical protein [Paraburkholderia aspalathi]